MDSHSPFDSSDTPTDADVRSEDAPAYGRLPNRLLTVFEVATFVGCHEETVRRAYLRGLLVSQRFGVRGRRFRPQDVLDFHPTAQACAVGTPWIRRGAPTRPS